MQSLSAGYPKDKDTLFLRNVDTFLPDSTKTYPSKTILFALILTADVGRVEEWTACGLAVLEGSSRTKTYKYRQNNRNHNPDCGSRTGHAADIHNKQLQESADHV
jgi:hypothetical protein